MANPSKRDAAAQKVVSVARSIVTYQIGLPTGCQRMLRSLTPLALHETDLPQIFEEYLSELGKSLPFGSERLLWDREVLREKDTLLEATSQRFRNRISRCMLVHHRPLR